MREEKKRKILGFNFIDEDDASGNNNNKNCSKDLLNLTSSCKRPQLLGPI